MNLPITPLLLAALLALTTDRAAAQTAFEEIDIGYPGVRAETLVRGFSVPWGMTFLNPGELLVTERAGRIMLLEIERRQATIIEGGPSVVARGQGGLMDVARGPDFERDGWIYFTYSKRVSGDAATTLARARLQNGRLVDWKDLLVTDSVTDTSRHFGSRITFDDQGHVFFSVGDRGERDLAQDLSNHIGTILRLRLDGSIPSDNPFVGNPDARDEIWSYGHRNPQGLIYDQPSRRLWSIEHGPRGGDEINLVRKGRNYGWPVISYGKEYWGPLAVGEGTHREGMEQPHKYYDPSIAPGSLILYRGAAFPEWQGDLFAGALKLQHLNRVSLDRDGKVTGEERLLEGYAKRIRALAVSPEGWLYLSTDSGAIIRLRPD